MTMIIVCRLLNDALNASDFNCRPLAVLYVFSSIELFYGSLADYENLIHSCMTC